MLLKNYYNRIERHVKQDALLAGVLLIAAILLLPLKTVAQEQNNPLPTAVERGGASAELPLGVWGPYSRTNLGPCCLVNRLLEQQFAFPIVIGQRREEVISVRGEGKALARLQRVVLERRLRNLAPVLADADDKAGNDPRNRTARIEEANGDGLYWKVHGDFLAAPPSQKIETTEEKATQPADWGAGEATVEYFPAFAEPSADGLLIRVTLTNRSAQAQTWFVDLLGGIETPSETFAASDLTLEAEPGSDSAVVRHARTAPLFALSSNPVFPLRLYRVTDAYFATTGAQSQRDGVGQVTPPGATTVLNGAGSKTENSARWALARVDEIVLAAGETRTLFLSIGIGKEVEAAKESAQTLLLAADDTGPNGKPRAGAYAKALAAHRAAQFASGNDVIKRLMAQSLANVPTVETRRLGVPSRQPTQGHPGGSYQPAPGGLIALAWSGYRPELAAAQINGWLLPVGDPDVPLVRPQATPPTNLFALWELYQRTHNHALLAHWYPYARRHYRELLAAGRLAPDGWLFGWPAETLDAIFTPETSVRLIPMGAARPAAPDYAAYVIRSAQIMRLLALETQRPADEVQSYADDAGKAAQALTTTLWDATQKRFHSLLLPEVRTAALTADTPTTAPFTASDLLPLLVGNALPPEQQATLLQNLTDPALFWSAAGVRGVAKGTPGYNGADGTHGAIRYGMNWLLWKALLDLGETDTAAKLADNLLRAYEAASTQTGGLPEWLDGETGAGEGVNDVSGDACVLIALQAAYHIPGTISTGWNLLMLDQHYDAARDTLHVAFRVPEPERKTVLLCALGKPNARYTATGAISGVLTTDAHGVLTLLIPHDPTTQALDLTPAPDAVP